MRRNQLRVFNLLLEIDGVSDNPGILLVRHTWEILEKFLEVKRDDCDFSAVNTDVGRRKAERHIPGDRDDLIFARH